MKHKCKRRIDDCIADELHEYNGNSGQGNAMDEFSTPPIKSSAGRCPSSMGRIKRGDGYG